MNHTQVSICLALVTLAVTACCASEHPAGDYLIFSDSKRPIKQLDWLKREIETQVTGESADEVAKLMRRLYAGPEGVTDDDQYELVELLVAAQKQSHRYRASKDISHGFVALVTQVYGSIEEFIKLVKSGEEPQHDVKLFRYLREFHVPMFRDTAELAANEASRRLADRDDLNALDSFFVQGEQILAHDDRQKLDPEHVARSMKSIDYACHDIRAALDDTLDLYNLGRAFGPRTEERIEGLDMRGFKPEALFYKLNEYNRICLTLHAEQSQ